VSHMPLCPRGLLFSQPRPLLPRKKETCKASTLLVHPEGHRFTRSCLKRPQLVSDSPLKPKKRKIRAMLLIVLADKEKQQGSCLIVILAMQRKSLIMIMFLLLQ
jgi:hypothetical protein